jgi:hypothetical protein
VGVTATEVVELGTLVEYAAVVGAKTGYRAEESNVREDNVDAVGELAAIAML